VVEGGDRVRVTNRMSLISFQFQANRLVQVRVYVTGIAAHTVQAAASGEQTCAQS